MAYANSTGSSEPAHRAVLPETMLFTHTSGSPSVNLSQRIRHVASDWACLILKALITPAPDNILTPCPHSPPPPTPQRK